MNFPFYIARRYLVAKKSRQAINIITLISAVGVAVGTIGLIIVLSVFNGLQHLVVSLYSSFDPDISITLKEGKVFDKQDFPIDELRKIKGVKYITEVIEENALIKYNDKQYIGTIKGVSEDFKNMSGVDSMIIEGRLLLQEDEVNFAVPGVSIADALGITTNDIFTPIDIYVPRHGQAINQNPDEAFNHRLIHPIGIFSIQQDFDAKYVLVPLRFARELLDYKTEVTGLELGIDKPGNIESVQDEIKNLLGNKYNVKNREQQHELLYKIMKSEKWAVYLILTFILIIATFNVIGSLTMLIIDKKRDINILWSMGADPSLIRKIFLFEGILISVMGAVSGLFIGFLVCIMQQKFEFVKMGGSFVVEAYPVDLRVMDFVYVFLTVLVIGLFAAWYPASVLVKRQMEKKLSFQV